MVQPPECPEVRDFCPKDATAGGGYGTLCRIFVFCVEFLCVEFLVNLMKLRELGGWAIPPGAKKS